MSAKRPADYSARRVDDFSSLSENWKEIVDKSHGSTVFSTHEWLSAAFGFFPPPSRPWVVVVHNTQGSPVLGAPLRMVQERWRGVPVRTLHFPTDPVALGVRCDLIVQNDKEETAVQAFAQFLKQRSDEWDYCCLDALPAGSTVLRYTELFEAAGLKPSSPSPSWNLHRLRVVESWDDYFATHGSHSRQHIRREARKLAALGAVTIDFAEHTSDVDRAIGTFFAIEERVSKRQRDNYTPLSDALKTYYRSLFAQLASTGAAYPCIMRIDGKPAACILAARHRNVIYTLNDVFDPDFEAGYPGHGLRRAVVEHAWNNHFEAIDFNGWGPHIERWRTEGHPHYRIELFSPSPRGRALRAYRSRLSPLLKRVLGKQPENADIDLSERGFA